LQTDEKRIQGVETTDKLPSKDVKGGWPMRGAQGGIGTLSWAGSDSSIAVLPEEKNPANGGPEGRAIPSETSENGRRQTISHDILQKQHEGNGADYHPTELYPRQPGNSTTSGHPNGGSTSHKPKFMDRVKGEAKIIAGKLGGNEEKIEQGMRLKGKDV
jgi:hypothetical protein